MVKPKRYTISDGKLVLELHPAEKGWYAVTSPLDPALNTQARSVEEAFVNAYDAKKVLEAARKKLLADSRRSPTATGPARRQKARAGSPSTS